MICFVVVYCTLLRLILFSMIEINSANGFVAVVIELMFNVCVSERMFCTVFEISMARTIKPN